MIFSVAYTDVQMERSDGLRGGELAVNLIGYRMPRGFQTRIRATEGEHGQSEGE